MYLVVLNWQLVLNFNNYVLKSLKPHFVLSQMLLFTFDGPLFPHQTCDLFSSGLIKYAYLNSELDAFNILRLCWPEFASFASLDSHFRWLFSL